MKKQHQFAGYLLIGIGLYFLMRQFKIPIFTDFYSWPTLLIIIGIALVVHSYSTRDYNNLFSGTILLGLGIHFHGLNHYTFWINHWAVYPLIVGIAFLVRFFKTKRGLFLGLFLIIISLIMIYSVKLPNGFAVVLDYIESYWPIVLIIIGIYYLTKKK